NAAVIVGPAQDWRELNLATLEATLALDGVALELPQRHVAMADTLPTLEWLACHAQRRGHALGQGDTVITGARIGPVPLGNAAVLEASAPGLGTVRIMFTR
ncbi:MAG: hydratase, partial [Cereibacter changlensis]